MKKVICFYRDPGLWQALLREYFSDVDVLVEKEGSPQNADLVFIEASFCQMGLAQKIRAAKNLKPNLRVFGLGDMGKENESLFDCIFREPCDLMEFTRKISDRLTLPESVNLLIADDDAEILKMVGDYFEGRHAPAFEVRRMVNGQEAFEAVQKKRPDTMILDMKMPVMKGSELYIKLQKQREKIPTIIFFDAISAGELDLVKKAGVPVIVEKGYRESSMPYLLALVKKLVYFSS